MAVDCDFARILELYQVRMILRKSGYTIFQNIGTFPAYLNRPKAQYITHEDYLHFPKYV